MPLACENAGLTKGRMQLTGFRNVPLQLPDVCVGRRHAPVFFAVEIIDSVWFWPTTIA